MLKFKIAFRSLSVVLLLAACSPQEFQPTGSAFFDNLRVLVGDWDVEEVKNLPQPEGEFERALFAEYVRLGAAERAEADWNDTTFFLNRARRLSGGRYKEPTKIDARDMPADVLAEVTDARRRLMIVLSGSRTGFFIREDLILTNQHVVEGSQFVEVKTFDGTKTFGMVTASDLRLDLAIVETKGRGTPVKLFSEKELPLGKSVIAIGHPKGLEFSFTQGVISGVRVRESSRARGGDPVRYIQTDTAINSGNSGGPLFLGSRVIGVNTFKKIGDSTEGLGFAVHYNEVKDFLSRNGVSIGPSS